MESRNVISQHNVGFGRSLSESLHSLHSLHFGALRACAGHLRGVDVSFVCTFRGSDHEPRRDSGARSRKAHLCPLRHLRPMGMVVFASSRLVSEPFVRFFDTLDVLEAHNVPYCRRQCSLHYIIWPEGLWAQRCGRIGRPGRGSSAKPSSRCSKKRLRHLLTTCRGRPSCAAISVLLCHRR